MINVQKYETPVLGVPLTNGNLYQRYERACQIFLKNASFLLIDNHRFTDYSKPFGTSKKTAQLCR